MFGAHRGSTDRAVRVAVGLGVSAAVVAGVMAASSQGEVGRAAKVPVASNGGARDWVAFTNARLVNTDNTLSFEKAISVVNTSTAVNGYAVAFISGTDGKRTVVCGGKLARGAQATCFIDHAERFSTGYFQASAAYPVVMGGSEQTANKQRVQDQAGLHFNDQVGVTQIPLDWQQGCPPKAGTGCPAGVTAGSGTTTTATQSP
jgi:hypothetical protein